MKNISKTTQAKNDRSDFYDRLKNGRPTIGWLGYEDVNAFNLWSGVAAVAQEHDANLIYFDIDALNSPVGFRAQSNILYDLAGRENIDGLISWQSSVVSYLTPDEAKQFFRRYAPLPIVGVGIAVEGVPSVLLDNYQGMYDVIAHLIEVHGCRRIAFIRGPEGHPEAEERYRAYAEALTRYDISFENNLVAPGTFEIEWASSIATEAISRFFDRQSVNVEAVVAATDAMACAALEALRARGLRVPDDVAVVGFDDIPKAECSTPPLTTARQPFYEMGRQAAEVLFT